jgi:hypothetical protein
MLQFKAMALKRELEANRMRNRIAQYRAITPSNILDKPKGAPNGSQTKQHATTDQDPEADA